MKISDKYSTKEINALHDFTDDEGIPMPRNRINLPSRGWKVSKRNCKYARGLNCMASKSNKDAWSLKLSKKDIEKSFRGCRKMKGKR